MKPNTFFGKDFLFILIVALLTVVATTTTIDAQNIINLDELVSGNQDHTAKSKVFLRPGYKYTPTPNNKMHAYIDETISCDVTYEALYDNSSFSQNSINTSLEVGTTAGSYNVALNGSSNYAIPIALPIGTKGITPNVSINYNSNYGNGMLGVGWSLSGLSSITRTSKDIYHDGEINPIEFNANDQFVMDGNRLVLNSGTHGANGATYKTEMENFSLITSNGNAGFAPSWFKVQTQSGIIYEYGNSTDSKFTLDGEQDVIIWNLNKMYDCYGNYIEFKYKNDARESRIDEILYTGNSSSGLAPYNKIKFHYSERQDVNTIYLGGSAVSGNNTKVDKATFANKHLLNLVEITAEGKHFKTYELKYGYDEVQSYLTKVIEYGSDGSPLNPTIFKYGEHNYKLGSLVQSNALYGNVADIIPGDFNGDGVSDVFVANYIIQDNVKFHTDLEVYINGSNGLSSSSPIDNNLSDYQVFAPINTKRNSAFFNSDYNGDGQDDILLTKLFTSVINGYSSLESVRIYHTEPNATAFTPTDYCNSSTYKYISPGDNFLLPGDFDGDGRKDFITIGRNSNGSTIKANLTFPATYNTCSDQITDVTTSVVALSWAEANDLNVIDFNGDGKDDIFVNDAGAISIYTYNVSGAAFQNVWNLTSNWNEFYFGDYNGDNKTDFLGKKPNNTWELVYSTGNSFIVEPFTFTNPVDLTSSTNEISIGDFDGNGKNDIVYSRPNQGSFLFDVYYSKGKSFYYEQYSKNVTTTAASTIKGDYNGDGNLDLIVRNMGGTAKLDIIYFNQFHKTRLLNKVANGFNTVTEFDYASLSQKILNPYTKGTGAYPLINIQLPMYVAESVRMPDGVGGEGVTNYFYEGAKFHMRGKGFLGFEKVTSENTIANLKTVFDFEFDEIFYGSALEKESTYILSTDKLISETTNNNNFIGKDGDKRYWVEPKSITSTDHLTDYTSTVTNSFNTNGSLTESIVNIGNVETITTTNTSFDIGCSWLYNLPQFTTTTAVRNGQSAYSTTVRNYYNSQGTIWKTIDFYGLPKAITTTYSNFDAFGNAQNIDVSASGQTTRSSSFEYDDEGRFATKKTNAINQSETATFDPKWGKPLKSTTIDGLMTTYIYDGFGRLEEMTPSTGNTAKTSWIWDIKTGNGTSTTSADNAVYYTYTQHPGRPDTKMWYDQFSRVRQTQTEAFNGELVNSVVSYDTRGHLKTETTPFYIGDAPKVTTINTYQDDLGTNPQYYNQLKSVSNSAGTTTFDYSTSSGEATVSVTNPANQVSSQTTDATGKVISSTDYGGTLIMEYFSHGNQKNTKLGTIELTSMQYDEYARQRFLVDKNAGNTEYLYNAYGELEYQKDAKNNESWFYYDQIGRADYTTIPEGTIDYQYVINGSGLGQIKKVVNYNGISTEYAYDNLVRVSQIKETIDGTLYTTAYGYDNFNNNTSVTYPSGVTINKQYDENSYLDKVTNASESITIFQTNEINSYGQYEKYTLGNGIVSDITYDIHGFPSNFKAGSVQDLRMDFDWETGNMESRDDLLKQKYESFQYDNLNRLKEVDVLNGGILATTFKNNGNIDTKTDAGTYTYSASKIHAIETVTNPSSVISATQQDIFSYDYTSFQQPEKITEGNYELNFTYGSDLNRQKTVLKQNGSTINTRYFLGNYEKNVKNGTEQHIHYITCGDGLNAIVVRQNGSDTYYYTYTDHLGSILTSTDASGNVIAEQSFDAWGRNRNPSDWTYNNIPTTPDWLYRGYTGHEQLPQFDLINMNGRIYDPVLGRMLSPDNLVPDPSSTQGYNRYTYAYNNPLKYTDPDGENPLQFVIAAAANVVNQSLQGNINGPGDFFFAAGIGAASSGAGIWAGNTVAANTVNSNLVSLSSAGVGGFVAGLGNGALQGLNIIDAVQQGISSSVHSAAFALTSVTNSTISSNSNPSTRGNSGATIAGTPDGVNEGIISIGSEYDVNYANGDVVNYNYRPGGEENIWQAVAQRAGGWKTLGNTLEVLPLGQTPSYVRLGGANGIMSTIVEVLAPIPPVVKGASLAIGSVKLLRAARVMHKHHVLPQQFRRWFASRGINNIHDYTVQISRTAHLRGVHGRGLGNMPGRWNQRWQDFITANPNARPSEIFHHAEGMLKRFGLEHLPYVRY